MVLKLIKVNGLAVRASINYNKKANFTIYTLKNMMHTLYC
jgi:hypothetical protein